MHFRPADRCGRLMHVTPRKIRCFLSVVAAAHTSSASVNHESVVNQQRTNGYSRGPKTGNHAEKLKKPRFPEAFLTFGAADYRVLPKR